MGIFSAIGKLFGGGNSGGAFGSRIAIKGDISPIPQGMITPDYRPQNGVYIGTSADLIREWEAKKWMLSPEDLQRLKEMHETLKNYEKLSKDYGKELSSFSKTEAKLVGTVTKTIPKVAGGNFAQYAANQKLNSDMDRVAMEYQKNISMRQIEAQKIQQQLAQFQAKIRERQQQMRGG